MLCIVVSMLGQLEDVSETKANRRKPAHMHVITELNERHQELSASLLHFPFTLTFRCVCMCVCAFANCILCSFVSIYDSHRL